jgi:DNA polymerase I
VLRHGPWLELNKKSQKPKTDKKTLKAIAEKLKCPFSKTLLEYRGAHKALTGFVHDIKLLSEYDGFLHTSFHLHGTSTGRLSSSNINMQNTPKKLAGVNIKKIFIPDDPEEELIFNVDWKGAEIRVFTAYAPDKALIEALNAGLDVHSWFTQEIFGIPYEEVEARKDIDEEMSKTRTTVKRVVFGILYGAMAKKIAETAGISEEAAQNVIDKLFDRFPSLRDYMDDVVSQIHNKGYVETLFGRRRRFPLQSVNGFFRGQAERRGKNMKIQSTSSDIVIAQLVEIHENIGQLGGRCCITVHDSIVGTIKKKHIHQAQAFFDYYCVQRVGEKFPWLPVAFAHLITAKQSHCPTTYSGTR